ncbi:Uma2 family endonuclease [Desulfococcaceae bacterium HSG8]|nr:Uma2 family endonuclease [Desulfococcaceae bacterium HSG8]
MSPSYAHSMLLITLGSEINKERKFRAFGDLTLVINGKDYTPDISVYKWRKANYLSKDIVKMEEMPLITVEIVSPTQGKNELFEKTEIYLQAGVQSGWIVDPQTHSIIVTDRNGARHFHEGILRDITGLNIDIGIVFEDE